MSLFSWFRFLCYLFTGAGTIFHQFSAGKDRYVLIFDVTDVMTENKKVNFGVVGSGFWGGGRFAYCFLA